jgi:hypothetical protein
MQSFPQNEHLLLPIFPMKNGRIGAGSSATGLNSIQDFEQILTLTDSERQALNHRRSVSGGYHTLFRFLDRP